MFFQTKIENPLGHIRLVFNMKSASLPSHLSTSGNMSPNDCLQEAPACQQTTNQIEFKSTALEKYRTLQRCTNPKP
jgi:hypothetical protein